MGGTQANTCAPPFMRLRVVRLVCGGGVCGANGERDENGEAVLERWRFACVEREVRFERSVGGAGVVRLWCGGVVCAERGVRFERFEAFEGFERSVGVACVVRPCSVGSSRVCGAAVVRVLFWCGGFAAAFVWRVWRGGVGMVRPCLDGVARSSVLRPVIHYPPAPFQGRHGTYCQNLIMHRSQSDSIANLQK